MVSRSSARNAPSVLSTVQNSGYFAASASENARMASTVRATSVENASARPSGESDTSRGSGADELDAPGLEPHVAHDRRPQRPDRVRQRGTPEPRRQLLGDRAPAHYRPSFEYERLEPSLGQVEGGCQAVGPRADNDHRHTSASSPRLVALLNARGAPPPLALARRLRAALGPQALRAVCYLLPPTSFSIVLAAFRPGAPMIPPPGCVADPHM